MLAYLQAGQAVQPGTKVLTAPIVDARVPLAPSTRESLPRASKRSRVREIVHARPFDIYVEFGLGARVLALYGTRQAFEVAKRSPLCARRYEGQTDRVARTRASLQ